MPAKQIGALSQALPSSLNDQSRAQGVQRYPPWVSASRHQDLTIQTLNKGKGRSHSHWASIPVQQAFSIMVLWVISSISTGTYCKIHPISSLLYLSKQITMVCILLLWQLHSNRGPHCQPNMHPYCTGSYSTTVFITILSLALEGEESLVSSYIKFSEHFQSPYQHG